MKGEDSSGRGTRERMGKNKRSEQHNRVCHFINELRFPDERSVAGGILVQKGLREGSRGGKGLTLGPRTPPV